MPETFALISSANIKREDFIDLLSREGAELNPDNVFDGRLSRGGLQVWIALDNNTLRELEAHDMELITQKLLSKPQTYITLEVSRKPGSERLAIKFACACAERWPCVVYNLLDRVFSSEELFELCKTNRGFED